MLELYTDGACRNNPGPGGYAFVIVKDEVEIKRDFGGLKDTTNNQMELLAVIKGLESIDLLKVNVNYITVYTDSMYIVDAVNKGWINNWSRKGWVRGKKLNKELKNRFLWVWLDNILNKFDSNGIDVKVEYIPGHSGHKWNELCDKLASEQAYGLFA
ncbi:MAG: ribonuclease H family protein [Halanaerobiales bacterium]